MMFEYCKKTTEFLVSIFVNIFLKIAFYWGDFVCVCLCIYIQGVSGGIVNILEGGNKDYSE
jgi:hypothetical protein